MKKLTAGDEVGLRVRWSRNTTFIVFVFLLIFVLVFVFIFVFALSIYNIAGQSARDEVSCMSVEA